MLISGLIHLGRGMPFIHGRDVQTMFLCSVLFRLENCCFYSKKKWNHMGHDVAQKVLQQFCASVCK